MSDAPIKMIVDCTTGEVSEIELTAEEIEIMEQAAVAAEAAMAAEQEAQAAREATRDSARTKLKDLGLTDEEVEALIP